MSKFTKEMVDMYADKLLIGLTDEENKMVLDEFDVIEKSMELIASIPDIEKVDPMTHALDDFEFVLREDKVEESITSTKEARQQYLQSLTGGASTSSSSSSSSNSSSSNE